MIQQDTPTKKICSYSFPWEHSHTIVNHKIYKTLQPDFNFGFGSRSSKSSPRHVCEPLSRVLLWKSSTIGVRRVTPLNSFLRCVTFENQCLYNTMKFLRRLLPGLQRKCRNNSLLRRELP